MLGTTHNHELIDIGVNLTHDSFDADRDAVVSAAQRAGISRFIVTGTTIDASEAALMLAGEYSGQMFSTAGIHPHHATEFDTSSAERLAELSEHPLVVAIGECGLDYFRNFSPPDAQRHAFEGQLAIAAQTRLPVFLHQRDAHDDFIAMLAEFRTELRGGVAHCFTGNRRQLEENLELGLHIGVTGWVCDERRGHELAQAVPHIPLDRIMLETDAPYLLPRNIHSKPKSRRNEPQMLIHVLRRVAELLRIDEQELAAVSTRNAERLFGLNKVVPNSD
jgi:TatD DNase family protein